MRRRRQDPASLLEEAQAAVEAGRFDKADALIAQAIEADPDLPRGYLLRAISQASQGEPTQALETLETLVQRRPDDSLGFSTVAGLQWSLGDTDRALASAARAEELAHDDPHALTSVATVYAMAEMPEKAREVAERALAVDPSMAGAHYTVGQAAQELGDNAAALEALHRAVELDPRMFGAHMALGMLHLEAQEWEDAIRPLEAASRLERQEPTPHAGLALAHAQLDHEREARSALRRALQYVDDDPGALFIIVQAQLALGQIDHALANLERLADLDTESGVPQMILGQVAASLGNRELLQQAYDQLVEINPEMAAELAQATGLEGGRRRARGGRRPAARARGSEGRVVYQLKVTLKGSKPPIWRRLLVPGDTKLSELHRILQIAFGWTDSHLHLFHAGGEEFADPGQEIEDTRSEKRVTLAAVVTGERSRFVYEYDFGDSWEHDIVVEKVLPVDPETRYPVCVAGKRHAPPEDCGGIWGYQESFLEALRHPEHPDHDEMLEWVGGEFDPEAFDLEEVNGNLKRVR